MAPFSRPYGEQVPSRARLTFAAGVLTHSPGPDMAIGSFDYAEASVNAREYI